MEDALRQFLAHRSLPRAGHRSDFPTFGGTSLRPGVDLDDSAELQDLMESPR
jgi:hypothetical protein